MINHIYRGTPYKPAATANNSPLEGVFCYRGVVVRPSQRKTKPSPASNKKPIIYRGVETLA